MKKLRLSLSFMLALFLIFASSTSVLAVENERIKYTAFGDSFTVGVGASWLGEFESEYLNGYTRKLYEHLLENYVQVDYVNYGIDIDSTSGAVLLSLTNMSTYDHFRNDVATSDIMTISIGGQDLVVPFAFLFNDLLYDYYCDEFTNIYDVERFGVDFKAWQENPSSPEYYLFNKLVSDVISEWDSALINFSQNFPSYIGALRAMDDDNKGVIYINTIFNPFVDSPIFHDAAEKYVVAMNKIIIKNAKKYSYKVVDVYTEFDQYVNPKKPVEPVELVVGDLDVLFQVNNGEPMPYIPLHPTDLGYSVIFDLHMDLMK